MADAEARWYVAHTYSGYENKVKANIEKSIQNLHLEDQILDVQVPMQNVMEVKNGQKKSVQKKLFPGYVLLHMIMNDETWYVVRNTRGVTGFVGPSSKPVPLSDKEVEALGVDTKQVEVDYVAGDNVKVVDGPLKDFIGKVELVDADKNLVKVIVSMFGRETPVELTLDQVVSCKDF